MKIWYFEADPETGLITAGYTADGTRHATLVRCQYTTPYVIARDPDTRERTRYNFTDAQRAALEAFRSGKGWSIEYKEGIA